MSHSTATKLPYFTWSAPSARDLSTPQEDVCAADPRTAVFAVADGVTRDRLSDGSYPDPSPARLAAEQFLRALRDHHELGSQPSEVFASANALVGDLNRALGLWSRADAGQNDLAGTVAALAQLDSRTRLQWAYIGDAGIALLSPSGDLKKETVDDVAVARRFFPQNNAHSKRERRHVIRSLLRNSPRRSRGSYGVLTGEHSALRFVRSGSWRADTRDVCVVFSDGFRPFLHHAEIRERLARGVYSKRDRAAIRALCVRLRNSGAADYSHEATVVVWAVRTRRV